MPLRILFVLLSVGIASALGGSAFASSIRVAVVEGVETLEVSASPLKASDQAGRRVVTIHRSPVKIVARGSDLEVGGKRFPVPVVRLEPTGSSALGIGGREYKGRFEVWRQGNALILVNDLPLEEYIVGALRGEVSEKWPIETLKAQAIVARSYAAYHRQLKGEKPYHLSGTTAHEG